MLKNNGKHKYSKRAEQIHTLFERQGITIMLEHPFSTPFHEYPGTAISLLRHISSAIVYEKVV